MRERNPHFREAHADLIAQAQAEHRLGWTETRVALLRTAYKEGLSFSEIARALTGTSRNAAIGKAHRIGLCGRPPQTPPRAARAARRTPGRRFARRPFRTAPGKADAALDQALAEAAALGPAPDPSGALTSVLTLSSARCAFPIGDPKALAQFAFCGRPRAFGAYCCAHAALCYVAPRAARQAAAR